MELQAHNKFMFAVKDLDGRPRIDISVGDQLVGIFNLTRENGEDLIRALDHVLRPHRRARGPEDLQFSLDANERCEVLVGLRGRQFPVQFTPDTLRALSMKFKAAAEHCDMMAQADKAGLN